MKRTLVLLVLALSFQLIYAQPGRNRKPIKWLSLSVRTHAGNSFLVNSNTIKDPNVVYAITSPSWGATSRLGVTVGDHVGVFAVGGIAGFGQNYTIYTDNRATTYSKNIDMQSVDYGGILRVNDDYGFFLETGLLFSKIRKVSEANTLAASSPVSETDFTDKFKNIHVAGGFPLFRSERIEINTGISVKYALSDIMKTSNYILSDGLYYPLYLNNYGTTKPLSVQLMLEFNYYFGFWGDASCGRGKLVLFQ